jgi:hypothetical protein
MRKLTWLTLGLLLVAGALAIGAAAAVPQNTSQPTISGNKFMVGEKLTADPGSWSGNPTSFDYQWVRCNPDGNGCSDIAGAHDKTYTVAEADVGKTIRVQVTAKNADGATNASSKATQLISGNNPPRLIQRPSISGKTEVGETLTADPGRWTQGPHFSYQWQQCDQNGASCKDIAGATGKTYGVRAVDKDNTIRVRVTATNAVDSNSAVSDRTAVITAGATPAPAPQPQVGVGGALSITAVSLPDRLIITHVQFTPNVIRSRTDPLTARFQITEAQGAKPVAGALVGALGIPANRVTNEAETTTDSTGWATITFHPLAGLPMRKGSTVIFFVRARKPGENPLAGVSTRRLVSVRVSP